MIPTFALLTQAASNLPSDASALERSISALESCISALDSSAETLANSSASLEPWSWVFTALVAVGVAMEFWVIWHEHREDTETWALTFFGVHRTLRPHFGRLIAEYISVALVAGGIVGELIVGIKIASFNTQLRSVDSQLRSKNAELRTTSDRLVALISSKAEEAEKQAKEADLARVKIEAAVAWRALDDKQKQEIGAALTSFSPKAGASIWYNGSSTEAQMFADDIADALRSGHITTTNVGGMLMAAEGGKWNGSIVRGQTGVIIQSTNNPVAINFALAVVKELSSHGFDTIRQTDPPFEKGSDPVIWINVEARPKGPQGEYKLQAKAKKQ
jgi:hypothetical protein